MNCKYFGIVLVCSGLVFGQGEVIREWSTLLNKIQKSLEKEAVEQQSFATNIKKYELRIDQLEKKLDNTTDYYESSEMEARINEAKAELFIASIIQLERKLELAAAMSETIEELTRVALRIDGGSKIQRKFKELIEQQNQLQYELRQTNQILSDVLVYFTPSSGASAFIQRYREATQRKIKMMKNYRQKSVRMDEVFLNKLENLQITIMERYDPMDIQLAVSEIEMELEVLQLVVGIQSIEVSGNLIEDLLTSSERK